MEAIDAFIKKNKNRWTHLAFIDKLPYMSDTMIVQGRKLSFDDIRFIRSLIEDNPAWNRTRLSRELCKRWNWYALNGQIKDMACRTMLLKLENRGYFHLPPRAGGNANNSRGKTEYHQAHETTEIKTSLNELTPLLISVLSGTNDILLFKTYLQRYHYLGLNTVVGENIKYMVYSAQGCPLACLLFGASAWKTEARDRYIGWNSEERKRGISLLANNSRFLILPWVRVKWLASHILAGIAKRISGDWQRKYGHPIYLLETFVEKDRFKGTCYQAANWIKVGETRGRGKNDRYNEYSLPVKSVWLYPLGKRFKDDLVRQSL